MRRFLSLAACLPLLFAFPLQAQENGESDAGKGVLVLGEDASGDALSVTDAAARALTRAKTYVCNGVGQRICRFSPGPVRVGSREYRFPGRAYPFRAISRDLVFVDAMGKRWVAPKGTLTDGASIPPAFIGVIGAPTSAEFASAAAIHDAYCGYGNEQGAQYQTRSWEEVHRVFYEALVVGGTPLDKAKTMYSDVLIGGPRWQPGASASRFALVDGHMRADLAGVPADALTEALERTIAFIEAEDPDPGQIDAFVEAYFAQSTELTPMPRVVQE
jgi:hypothetical protein